MRKANYQKVIKDNGVEIEAISYYDDPPDMVMNPPNNNDVFSKIEAFLRGTGIAKISVTFLNENRK